jgi:TolA-binding protein
MICIKSSNNSSWQAHEPNTVLEKIVSADNCSSTTIGCGAVAQLEFTHESCATPSTQQQVEKLEINVEQKIEQAEQNVAKQVDQLEINLEKKIENLAKTNDNDRKQILKKVKEADKKMQTLETNMKSLTRLVNDTYQGNSTQYCTQFHCVYSDQTEMSLEMMKLVKLMKKHSETPMAEGTRYIITY